MINKVNLPFFAYILERRDFHRGGGGDIVYWRGKHWECVLKEALKHTHRRKTVKIVFL
jgi:uncharacterized protein with PIN domain